MTRICCVCRSVIEYCIDGTMGDSRVSHGVCKECAKVEMRNLDDLTRVKWQGWQRRDEDGEIKS